MAVMMSLQSQLHCAGDGIGAVVDVLVLVVVAFDVRPAAVADAGGVGGGGAVAPDGIGDDVEHRPGRSRHHLRRRRRLLPSGRQHRLSVRPIVYQPPSMLPPPSACARSLDDS